jgi:hypothetical protein
MKYSSINVLTIEQIVNKLNAVIDTLHNKKLV